MVLIACWVAMAESAGLTHKWCEETQPQQEPNPFVYSRNKFVVRAALYGWDYPNSTEVKWMHIPKAGTSIWNTVIHFCYPSLPASVRLQENQFEAELEFERGADARCSAFPRSHWPMDLSLCQEDVLWLTMVRDPVKRLVSAYKYGGHAVGLDPLERGRLLADSVTTLPQFADFPGVKGCQARMLSGSYCASEANSPFTALDGLRLSRTVIHRMGFIGLTERWDESVCLFHAMYGGEVFEVEFQNNRPSDTIRQIRYEPKIRHPSPILQEHIDMIEDPVDSLAYTWALRWFDEQLRYHSQAVESCLKKNTQVF